MKKAIWSVRDVTEVDEVVHGDVVRSQVFVIMPLSGLDTGAIGIK